MRRHNFDPISFILGALFAAIGLTFLFGNADLGDFHLAVVWPLPLIVIGLLMLVTTLQRRTRHETALTPAPRPGATTATVPATTMSAPAAGASEPAPTLIGPGPGTTHDVDAAATDDIDGLDEDEDEPDLLDDPDDSRD
jgi:hypothetical protein